ncbi:MAG: hypothetical protein QNJ74_20435 [Trichodesmium sp. MO_231.B1]|nr:hypothetical protein [Trichodesmium sp. MO_231.B1]
MHYDGLLNAFHNLNFSCLIPFLKKNAIPYRVGKCGERLKVEKIYTNQLIIIKPTNNYQKQTLNLGNYLSVEVMLYLNGTSIIK